MLLVRLRKVEHVVNGTFFLFLQKKETGVL